MNSRSALRLLAAFSNSQPPLRLTALSTYSRLAHGPSSGIIYPGNRSFNWVSSDSKGYNHGRILGPDTITACYVEAGEQSTAGCAELTRQDDGE